MLNNQDPLSSNYQNFDKNSLILAYIFFALGYFTGGLTSIVGVIMAYAKRNDSDEILKSHYNSLIKIFWYSLLWVVIGSITTIILVGWFILLGWFIWSVYKLIIGVIKLGDNLPVK
jgi:uncharacterized membrane protein